MMRSIRNRWAAVVVALAALLGSVTACGSSSADTSVTLVTSVRSVANPYHAVWVAGSKAFAQSAGLANHLVILQSGDDSQKQLTDLQSYLASHSGPIAVLADPNTTSIAQALVRTVQNRPKTWIVTAW